MSIISPLKKPFAYARNDNVEPSYNKTTPDNVANQETGFPVLQAEDLSSPDATPVKEQEMNGVIKFYSNYLYKLGLGGVFSFNQELSDLINGYPIGAVLWCPSNKTFQVSLMANNTANFGTNPSFINDGIHWRQEGANYPDITDNETTGDVVIGGRISDEITGNKTTLIVSSRQGTGPSDAGARVKYTLSNDDYVANPIEDITVLRLKDLQNYTSNSFYVRLANIPSSRASFHGVVKSELNTNSEGNGVFYINTLIGTVVTRTDTATSIDLSTIINGGQLFSDPMTGFGDPVIVAGSNSSGILTFFTPFISGNSIGFECTTNSTYFVTITVGSTRILKL
jgi:hypothetical protein